MDTGSQEGRYLGAFGAPGAGTAGGLSTPPGNPTKDPTATCSARAPQAPGTRPDCALLPAFVASLTSVRFVWLSVTYLPDSSRELQRCPARSRLASRQRNGLTRMIAAPPSNNHRPRGRSLRISLSITSPDRIAVVPIPSTTRSGHGQLAATKTRQIGRLRGPVTSHRASPTRSASIWQRSHPMTTPAPPRIQESASRSAPARG